MLAGSATADVPAGPVNPGIPATPVIPADAGIQNSSLVVVAKGPVTRIATGGVGGNEWTDAQGPSALATAGSGDVLSGSIAALLAQGLAPADAAGLGVRLQAKAALAGVDALTSFSLNARDLIDYLPQAARALLAAAGAGKEGQ
jgi:NAD(P)H-hydrate epimerase